jgi:hypothetical protein
MTARGVGQELAVSQRAMDCRRALEALRSGVPNQEAVGMLGSNQTSAERVFLQRLETVSPSAHDGIQTPGLLIAGGFGAGKSHLLDYLAHISVARNFVCSRVVISKETQFFDPAKMYAAAMEGAMVPSLSGEAVREIALRLQPHSPQYAQFIAWANGPASGLSDLFRATILLYGRLSNDPELVDAITNFWAGERIALSRVRQGLKQIGAADVYTLQPVKAKDLAQQRFIFASRLIVAAGYNGWVLLVDELELVGRYSLVQRGRSYAELARWMGRVEGHTCPGLLTVAAITDDFSLAVLHEKGDRDSLAARLRAKESDEFIAMASRAETGMRIVEREALLLEPPADSVLRETYEKLKAMHAQAYDWTPPDLPAIGASRTRRLRSYVRRWVNQWDLLRLYPGTSLSVDTEEEIGPGYVEDTALEQSNESALHE